jgi:hypothetical protein
MITRRSSGADQPLGDGFDAMHGTEQVAGDRGGGVAVAIVVDREPHASS